MKPSARPPAAVPDIWFHKGGVAVQLHFLINRSGRADATTALRKVHGILLGFPLGLGWEIVTVCDEFKIRIETPSHVEGRCAYKLLIQAAREAGVEAA